MKNAGEKMENTDKKNSYIVVSYKKSSSDKGGIGYDIDCCACEGVTEEEMTRLGTIALNTARKIREVI